MKTRSITEIITGHATSDGAGVNLQRIFGGNQPERFDPFLLLDEFGSDKADDYIAGFPPHPHRGFETITYMLEGKMEHRDHMDNVGLLSDGGVQWMTAGSGVIHSEMPKQTEGLMRGFQLWVNLPANKKMQPARYEDIDPKRIPEYHLENVFVKAIAGQTQVNETEVNGFFDVPDTEAHYFDVHVSADTHVTVNTPAEHTVLVYVYEGELTDHEGKKVKARQLARFYEGDQLVLHNNGSDTVRFLVLTGKPLREPIKQYGPFVMNTAEEIDQAVQDYRDGTLITQSDA